MVIIIRNNSFNLEKNNSGILSHIIHFLEPLKHICLITTNLLLNYFIFIVFFQDFLLHKT